MLDTILRRKNSFWNMLRIRRALAQFREFERTWPVIVVQLKLRGDEMIFYKCTGEGKYFYQRIRLKPYKLLLTGHKLRVDFKEVCNKM